MRESESLSGVFLGLSLQGAIMVSPCVGNFENESGEMERSFGHVEWRGKNENKTKCCCLRNEKTRV